VAQLERRRWLRLTVGETISARIQFTKKLDPLKTTSHFSSKHLLDIGAGGGSFVVSKLEAKSYLTGDIIKGLEVLINDRKITCDAEILRVHELKPNSSKESHYRVWKISLRFLALAKSDEEFISSFVFEKVKLHSDAV
jgi:c-di-GMP-binding flagellar brake protein YcgR